MQLRANTNNSLLHGLLCGASVKDSVKWQVRSRNRAQRSLKAPIERALQTCQGANRSTFLHDSTIFKCLCSSCGTNCSAHQFIFLFVVLRSFLLVLEKFSFHLAPNILTPKSESRSYIYFCLQPVKQTEINPFKRRQKERTSNTR